MTIKKIFEYWVRPSLITAIVLLLAACSTSVELAKPQAEYIKECWSCSLLNLIYNAVGSEIMRMHATFTTGVVPLMMVAFSIWLALRLFKFVSSVSENNVSEVWNEILRKIFVCMLCASFAATPQAVQAFTNLIVFPIYEAFLELGVEIMSKTSDSVAASSYMLFGEEITVRTTDLACKIGDGGISWDQNGFPTSLRDTMMCMIRMVDETLDIGRDISIKAMTQTTSFTGRIIGFAVWICFRLVQLMFVFYLVDSIFKMGLIILMLPLFIVSYAFGPTKKWATIGLSNILVTAGFMMCFSIVVSLSINAIIGLVQNNPNIFNPSDPELSMSEISVGSVCMLLIGFLIFGSMGVSEGLVSSLVGGSMSSKFQENLKAAVQMVISLGQKLGKKILTMAFPQLKVVEKMKALTSKLNHLAGRKDKDD
ncbi:MAG: hypothetical protein MJ210_00770 [Alphaproteobacteria bacterium]|nr:hypothetical protein [Alphaproteobacteria bacterium]